MHSQFRFGTNVKILFGILAVIFVGTVIITRIEAAGGAKDFDDDDDFSEFDDDIDEDLAFRKKRQEREKVNVKEQEAVKAKEEVAKDLHQAKPPKTTVVVDDDDEVVVEEDDFEGIDVDDDEFEYEPTDQGASARKREPGPPKLTISSVPMPMRGWQGYWAELLMLLGITVYLLNYVMGRYKNQKIAQTFFDMHWPSLEENFHFLGDNSTKVEDETGKRQYSKMSDSLFQMWCSGRVCCEGMLVELKLLKRQDIVGLISNIFRPTKDIFRCTVELAKEDMESVVFAVATKKAALKISKEYNDLIQYCPEKKAGEKFGLPSQFVVLSELNEVISAALDSKTISVINKCAPFVESIHFTDQFTGTKAAEPELTKDGLVKSPEPKRLLIFTFVLPLSLTGNNAEQAVEDTQNLLPFVFHTIDRIRKIHLSKEGKAKADKNRSKVEEAFMKQTHAARAEALAAKKEEQRRAIKERILQEDDPEKQRRWEEKEQKREKKRKQPKMKQMKVKAM